LVRWSQAELSRRARVALGTIKRLESEDGPVNARTDTLRRLIAVFEKAGVEFLNEETPGVRFRGRR
jgi:predicted transcriptional regulator